jgi:hypothetical protein
MTREIRRSRCPDCRRKGIRLTQGGTLWRHKPYTRLYSGEMVDWCAGSGEPPKRRDGVSRETV